MPLDRRRIAAGYVCKRKTSKLTEQKQRLEIANAKMCLRVCVGRDFARVTYSFC